jgi:repressor of nif and glnA expression
MEGAPQWIEPVDVKILSLLADTQAIMDKRMMVINCNDRDVTVTYEDLIARLPVLEEHGMIDLVRDPGKYYKITQRGAEFVHSRGGGSRFDAT